jgi:2-(1,2-epoxy-1,2-dihydrophenyl)acetyl-CoA isomerase
MSGEQTIKVNISSGVATLTLARPARLNALSREMVTEIKAALDSLPRLGARAILLTGEGRAFCSGVDLVKGGDPPTKPEDGGEILETHFNPLIERLGKTDLPIIAAVNGAAAGAGCSLALAADFVVAARSAYFLLAFVRIGLVPDAGATWILPRLVGLARATEMMLLGERVGAEQAVMWGMIYKVVDDDALIASATELAATLARGPTRAYSLIRQAIRAGQMSSLSASLALERTNQKLAADTEDYMEGVRAFIEKREARFQGR